MPITVHDLGPGSYTAEELKQLKKIYANREAEKEYTEVLLGTGNAKEGPPIRFYNAEKQEGLCRRLANWISGNRDEKYDIELAAGKEIGRAVEQHKAFRTQRCEPVENSSHCRLIGKTGAFLGGLLVIGLFTSIWLALRNRSTPADYDDNTGITDFSPDVINGHNSNQEVEILGYFTHSPYLPPPEAGSQIREDYSYAEKTNDSKELVTKHNQNSVLVRLRDWLDNKHSLNEKKGKKELLLVSLSEYILEHSEQTIRQKRLIKIAEIINKSESLNLINPLTSDRAEKVVQNWVYKQVLDTTPELYISGVLQKIRDYADVTIGQLIWLLSVEGLKANKLIDLSLLNDYQKDIFKSSWDYFIKNRFPYIGIEEDNNILSRPLNSIDFANYDTGARYLHRLGIDVKNVSEEEIIATGVALWNKAMDGGSIELIPDLLISSWYHFITNSDVEFNPSVSVAEEMKSISHLIKYIEYRKEIDKFYIKYPLLKNFMEAFRLWKTKGELADEYIGKCPETGFFKFDIKQNYMDGIGKPCDSAADNLLVEYKKRTELLADSYAQLDRELIEESIDYLDEDDKKFIFNKDAVISKLYPELLFKEQSAIFFDHLVPVSGSHVISVKQNRADIFSVKVDKEERIYSLKAISDEKSDIAQKYIIYRIKKHADYLEKGIVIFTFSAQVPKDEKGNPVVNTFELAFKMKMEKEGDIKEAGDIKSNITNYCVEQHKNRLYDAFYEKGNDKSVLDIQWEFLKDMTPFLRCGEKIKNDDRLEAAISCSLDLLSVSPIIKAGKLSTNFGLSMATAMKNARKIVNSESLKKDILEKIARELTSNIKTPTLQDIAELAAELGKNLNPDPGFYQAVKGLEKVSKYTNDKLADLLENFKKDLPSGSKLIELIRSGKAYKNKTPLSTHVVMARFEGTKIDIPVKILYEKDGETIARMIVPESGELYGDLFLLTKQHKLQPMPGTSKGNTGYDFQDNSAVKTYGSAKIFQLDDFITSDMYVKDVEKLDLSLMNSQGLVHEVNNLQQYYIKFNEGLIRVEKTANEVYIKLPDQNRLYIAYDGENLIPVRKVSPEQQKLDDQINSKEGWKITVNEPLTKRATLIDFVVKAAVFDDTKSKGSSLQITSRIAFEKGGNTFENTPPLTWLETIKCKVKGGKVDTIWQITENMVFKNPNSNTFFSWTNRYIEAYEYAMALDKIKFLGFVKIYTRAGKELSPGDLPIVYSREDKARAVQEYFRKNGGVLQITIEDRPALNLSGKDGEYVDKERLIDFNIGFKDMGAVGKSEILLNVKQMISVKGGKVVSRAITVSDDIYVAQGKVNAKAPDSVTRKRYTDLSPGTYMRKK